MLLTLRIPKKLGFLSFLCILCNIQETGNLGKLLYSEGVEKE
jgi:hypothetical protein